MTDRKRPATPKPGSLAAARARIATLELQLAKAVGLLVKQGFRAADIGPVLGLFDWETIARGGNNRGGIIDGIGLCP